MANLNIANLLQTTGGTMIGPLTINAPVSSVPISIVANISQSTDLQDWSAYGGSKIVSITKGGNLAWNSNLMISGVPQAFAQPIVIDGITPSAFMYLDSTYNQLRIGVQGTPYNAISFELPSGSGYRDVIAISNTTLAPSSTFNNLINLGTSGNAWKSLYVGTGDSYFGGNLTLQGLTQGSVPFVGSGGLISQNNSNLFWDNTNLRLGIGTTSPLYAIHVIGDSLVTGNMRVLSNGNNGFLFDNSGLVGGKNNWNLKCGSDGTLLFDQGGGLNARFKLGGTGGGNTIDFTPDYSSSYFIVKGDKSVKTYNNTLDNGSGLMQPVAFATKYTSATITGTTQTIDFSQGNTARYVLENNVTFTFTNPTDQAHYTLHLLQDATGSRTVTWPSSIVWAGGTTPTLTTTANYRDVFTFIYDATAGKYLGTATLNFSA